MKIKAKLKKIITNSDNQLEKEESSGQAIKFEGDIKNFYAWLGFEETARNLAEKIGLEL